MQKRDSNVGIQLFFIYLVLKIQKLWCSALLKYNQNI